MPRSRNWRLIDRSLYPKGSPTGPGALESREACECSASRSPARGEREAQVLLRLRRGSDQSDPPRDRLQRMSNSEGLFDLALGYGYLHSNAPPGGCGCFNMNGGNATFAWPIGSGQFALAGDVTIAHAGTVSTSGDSLTLSTFTGGGRYCRVWDPRRCNHLVKFCLVSRTRAERWFRGRIQERPTPARPLRVVSAEASICERRRDFRYGSSKLTTC